MKIKLLAYFLVCSFAVKAQSQHNEYVQKGEFGITLGVAHYFGDLNTRAAINRPKPALGAFFRKQFGNYVGVRLSAHYAQLGYSDAYSKNEYQHIRNLSFNTNIWEIALQGDFNFFKFVPGDPDYSFTPYITLGVGVFTYDPYAFTNGEKEFLRPLGTEGQLTGFNGRKPYNTMAMCIPLGVGIKYNLSDKINFSFEVAHRFTTTDYLDDVSSVYVDKDLLEANRGPKAVELAYRGGEIKPNPPYPKAGALRGASPKDWYYLTALTLSYRFPEGGGGNGRNGFSGGRRNRSNLGCPKNVL